MFIARKMRDQTRLDLRPYLYKSCDRPPALGAVADNAALGSLGQVPSRQKVKAPSHDVGLGWEMEASSQG